MTLKELQKRIERTGGKDLPTAAWLRAGNSPLAISREIAKSGKLSVFVNGFALYETEDGSTVFRVPSLFICAQKVTNYFGETH